jgi:hypothetical protein
MPWVKRERKRRPRRKDYLPKTNIWPVVWDVTKLAAGLGAIVLVVMAWAYWLSM